MKLSPTVLTRTERRQKVAELLCADAEHFNIDVLARLSHESIANPAANDERAPAGVAHRRRDVGRDAEIGRLFHRHRSLTVRKP